MIKIDKDVSPLDCHEVNRPTNPSKVNPGKKSKYPFEDMEIGDSFFVEGENAYYNLDCRARGFMRSRGGRNRHFAVKPEEKGARCWLIGIDND